MTTIGKQTGNEIDDLIHRSYLHGNGVWLFDCLVAYLPTCMCLDNDLWWYFIPHTVFTECVPRSHISQCWKWRGQLAIINQFLPHHFTNNLQFTVCSCLFDFCSVSTFKTVKTVSSLALHWFTLFTESLRRSKLEQINGWKLCKPGCHYEGERNPNRELTTFQVLLHFETLQKALQDSNPTSILPNIGWGSL